MSFLTRWAREDHGIANANAFFMGSQMLRSLGIFFAIAVVSSISVSHVARAGNADSVGNYQNGGWQYRVSPYAWLTSMDGDMAIRGREFSVDASFVDVVKESDSLIAFMLNSEARNGRFSILSDTIFARITASQDDVRESNPLPGLSLRVAGDLGVEFQMFTQELSATYELLRRPGNGGSSYTALDLVAGGRYWNIQAEAALGITTVIDLPALGLKRTRNRAIADGGVVDWFDPLIGLRARHQLTPGQELFARADVGGFGVGSDISWNLIAGYSWDCGCEVFGAKLQGLVGYRALYADYSEGSGNRRFEWDLWLHGPVVAANFRF